MDPQDKQTSVSTNTTVDPDLGTNVGEFAKKKMTRKEFLAYSGAGLLSLMGIGSIIEFLRGESKLTALQKQLAPKYSGVLTDVGDVSITDPTTGDVLTYDQKIKSWVNAYVSMTSLADTSISGSLSNQVLAYNAGLGKWVNQFPSLSWIKDVIISNPANAEVLTYDATTSSWTNKTLPAPVVSSVNNQTGNVAITAAGIGALASASDLSDLTNAGTARINLGLGTAATQNVSSANGVASLDGTGNVPVNELGNVPDIAFTQGGNSFGKTAVLGTNDNQALTIETAGVQQLFITNTGDIGLSTTTPQAHIDILTTPLIGPGGWSSPSNSIADSLQMTQGTDMGTTYNSLENYTLDNAILALQTPNGALGEGAGTVTALRILIEPWNFSSTNDGVAISFGPDARSSRIIHYGDNNNSTGSRLQLQTQTSNNSGWNPGLIIYDNGNSVFGLGYNGADPRPANLLTVNGGASIGSNYVTDTAPTNGLLVEGNVGIGTASPSYGLDVQGSVTTIPIASMSNTSTGFTSQENNPALALNGWLTIHARSPVAGNYVNLGAEAEQSGFWDGPHLVLQSGTANLVIAQNNTDMRIMTFGATAPLSFQGFSYINFEQSLQTSGTLSVNGTGNSSVAGKLGVGTSSPSDTLEINGNLNLDTAGNKIKISTGTNASVGSGTLASGTATILTTAVTASSLIFLTATSTSSNQGILSVGTLTAGTSFVVNSTNSLDTNTFNWWIVN